MAAAVSDEAWLEAMLAVEAALARAEAAAGVIPVEAAAAIEAACDPARFDLERIGREAIAAATPVVPLVKALTAAAGGEAAGFVHWGATSQDVVDTAMMLVARRAVDLILADLDGLAAACARLAERHRGTLMVGRTLLQQALPITFGLKAAGWLVAVQEAREALGGLRDQRLAVQLGGASGTLASLGDRGLEVMSGLAQRLGLAEPALPWHGARGRVAELGSALAVAAGTAGKVALDVALLMQTEVGEVAEAAPGASSAMPHKRNPVAAVEVDACARGVQAELVVLVGALRAEHERAAGAWQAEWPALTEALRLTGGAAARARQALDGLHVDERRMRANLELTGGLVLSERVALALASGLGRGRAREVVEAAAARVAAGGGSLGDELLADPAVARCVTPEELEHLLEPGGYLGSTAAFVDRALARWRAGAARTP